MAGPALDTPHFAPEWVDVRNEEVALVDGRGVGEVVVAETPVGTVTRWASEEPRRAYTRALSAALAGEFDPVPFRDVLVRHDEESHIRGGTVRAVAPAGCKTVWGDKERGCTPDAVRRALMPVLKGEISCPRCGHDTLETSGTEWICPECERVASP